MKLIDQSNKEKIIGIIEQKKKRFFNAPVAVNVEEITT